MRIALIANPRSGTGRDPNLLADALTEAGVEDIIVCRVDELERARGCEPERIVLAGGDGSIAPAAELAGELGVPLALLPVGTANDFARAAGIPRVLEQAVALAASGVRTEPWEIGWIEGPGDAREQRRPFVNVAQAGLASVAAKRATPLKPRLGPLAYGVGAARAGATGHPLPIVVESDSGEIYRGGAWQVIVACTGAFGGGSGVGATRPDDGLLDVVVIPAGSRLRLAQRAWGLRAKSISDQSGVLRSRSATISLTLTDGGALELNVDGEIVEHPAAVARFAARAGAFELVVP